MISSPYPLRTALSMNRLKPFICSSVIVGGIDEFLPAHDDFDQSGSVMLESLRDHRSHLIRCFGRQPQEPGPLGDFGEVRVVQVGAKIEDAGRLHFQFDKGQRVVLEDDHLDWQL